MLIEIMEYFFEGEIISNDDFMKFYEDFFQSLCSSSLKIS